jgi:hypothetical protein
VIRVELKLIELNKILNYALVFCLVLTTCKKKTSIDVILYSYALNEPVANAKIGLVQRKLHASSGTYSCEEVDSKITDAMGHCNFDREKLRTNSSYQYFIGIAEAYGKPQDYPCGGKSSGFLKVGEKQNQFYDVGIIEAYVKVQINNLMSPSIIGDSLFVAVANPKYQIPGQPNIIGGGSVLLAGGWNTGFSNYPAVIITEGKKTDAGKNTVHIRKRKMGVVTTSIDTVKIYPYETKVIEINW